MPLSEFHNHFQLCLFLSSLACSLGVCICCALTRNCPVKKLHIVRESYDEVNDKSNVVEKFEVGNVSVESSFNEVIWGAQVLHNDKIEALFKCGDPNDQIIDSGYQEDKASKGLKGKTACNGNALSKSCSDEHPVLIW